MTAVFVTSSGTDIGKTFVTAGLIRHFRRSGGEVGAIKPIVSGFDPEAAESSDPGILLTALARPVTPEEIARISPWRFKAALSPDMAAKREGCAIDFAAVVEFSRRAAAASDMLFIEGVGGIMVPIDARRTVLDWMTTLRFPVVLVVGSYLGSFSHTLTALHVLAQRKLTIAAVVVSETPASAVPLDETVATIANFADIDVMGLPRLASATEQHPIFARLASLL